MDEINGYYEGYPPPPRRGKARARFEAMIDDARRTGYLTVGRNRDSVCPFASWERECRATGRAFAVVHIVGARHAWLELKLANEASDEQISRATAAVRQRYPRGRAGLPLGCGPRIFSVFNIRREHIETLVPAVLRALGAFDAEEARGEAV